MIRIFFDHQCELNKKLWEYRFFNLLMNELSKDNEFEIIHSFNENGSLELLKKSEDFDIFCPTGLNKYYLRRLKHTKKLCLFVHHMIYELLGNKANNNMVKINEYIKNKAEQIFLSDKIIVPSNETYRVLSLLYKSYDIFVPKKIENKLNLIPYSININENFIEDKPEDIIIEFPYILYPNYRIDFIDYHGLSKMIETIKDWLIENNIKLVIVGQFLENNILNIIKTNKLENYIFVYLYEDEEELYNLYRNSLCTICPEIIEGFPYYILESWNNNSLTLINEENYVSRSIAGENGMYFNFDNLVHCLNVILNINLDMYNDLINNQKEQLKLYDISNNIDSYKKLFKELIKK